MPAIDFYERHVINALQKAGWHLDDPPHYLLKVANRKLYIDLEAQRFDQNAVQSIIVVEVKGFEGGSALRRLEEAVGQYVVYRALLEETENAPTLYLAVPMVAYAGILSEQVGQIVRKRVHIKMIVVDIEREEIVQWLD